MIRIPNFEEVKKMPYEYYNREGFVFYFRNEYHNFDVELRGKELFDFVDNHNIGDFITFY